MTLAELMADVYTITNRPDLTAETQSAVLRATVKLHSVDFFPKDMVEIDLTVPTPGLTVQIDVNAVMPRFRGIAYIRDASSLGTTNTYNKLFTQIDARGLLDDYNLEKQNVWYLGGQVVNIRSSTTVSALLVGYYSNPTISPAGSYTSWIAVDLPYAIVDEAAATIFRLTGNAEMARFYEQQSMQNILLLRQNYLEGVAR